MTLGALSLDAIHLGLFLLVLGLGGALAWAYGAAGRRSATAETELRYAREDETQARAEIASLREQLKTQTLIAQEAREELAAARARSEEDERKFADLAQQVLDRSSRRFLDRAEEHFNRHKEGAQANLKELMTPIGKNLEEFAKRIKDIEKVRTEDKSAIAQQIEAIQTGLTRHTAETNKLVSALSAPKSGGRWGETTLRNVMEHAGLSAFCDFSEQVHGETESGRQRPDVIIKLPGGREIVVDSKVSLEDYLRAVEETDPARRTAHLRAHARKVRDHIKTLGSKSYQDSMSSRVDFVALFIPGENFYVAALEHEPDLFDFAAARQVIVVTPSTLLALAKAVAYGWRQEQASENARQAAELGRELYSRLATLGGHVEKMGKSLNSAVDAYNRMGSSLTSRVLPAARKFEDLQIAPPEKSVPEIESIEKRATLPERTGELSFEPDYEASETS